MNTALFIDFERMRAVAPFAGLAGFGVVAGGFLAALVAADPARAAVWSAAYLVLVVGVVQLSLGAGQILLATEIPSLALIGAEWIVLNAGNAAVIAGTLVENPPLVGVGGFLFATALALFLYATRKADYRRATYVYRILVVLVLVSDVIGVGLSASGA
jgi:heme A synthase